MIQSKEEQGMQILSHGVMIILSLLALLPFILLITASISDDGYALKYGYKFIPKELSLDAYRFIFTEAKQIGRAYIMTIIVTVLGTFLSVVFTTTLSYGLIQKVKGTKVIFILILITMLFNGGIVPTYIVYNNFLHVKNTIWGLILPNLMMNGFTVILVKNYLQQNIPQSLLEAAKVDGSSHYRIFYAIVLPLSKPIMATIGLMTAVIYWNDWINGLYYISDEKLYTIQLLLNKMNENILFMANNSSNMQAVDLGSLPTTTMRLAIAVIGVLPIIVAYPFFQKYFVKGITIGSVKG